MQDPDSTDFQTQENSTQGSRALSIREKWLTGFLLIFFTCFAIVAIIACWPDRLPQGKNTTYHFHLFHVSLIDPDQGLVKSKVDSDKIKIPDINTGLHASGGTGATVPPHRDLNKKSQVEGQVKPVPGTALTKDTTKKDSAENPDNHDKVVSGQETEKSIIVKRANVDTTIQLSTLLLILVALAGFLGNMVHIGTSLTTFIGADQFKRSWILWYCIKPFTAAGLALILYLALNGGNSGKAATGDTVNLNMIIGTAALAGLFTDIATQKLKEIFTAIFKPSDNRPDKLTDNKMTLNLNAIQPDKIDVTKPNDVIIPAQNLDSNNLIIKMLGAVIANAVITPTLIRFTYTVAPADAGKTTFDLVVTDKSGAVIGVKNFSV
jgi:hypothetical protein